MCKQKSVLPYINLIIDPDLVVCSESTLVIIVHQLLDTNGFLQILE